MTLPQPVGHAGPRRIGLLGAECSGKTSLAQALAAQLPACVVDEALRDFVDARGRAPRREEQLLVLEEQAAREEHAARTCTLPWLVVDPAPVMTAAYSIDYFGDDGLLEAGIRQAQGYALMAWCAPDIPWHAQDTQRDGPERRDSTHAVLAATVVPALRAAGIPVLEVVGPVADRVAQVVREVVAWQHRAPEGQT